MTFDNNSSACVSSVDFSTGPMVMVVMMSLGCSIVMCLLYLLVEKKVMKSCVCFSSLNLNRKVCFPYPVFRVGVERGVFFVSKGCYGKENVDSKVFFFFFFFFF